MTTPDGGSAMSDDAKVLAEIVEAATIYEQYVEIAGLARLTPLEDPAPAINTYDSPLSLVIRT